MRVADIEAVILTISFLFRGMFLVIRIRLILMDLAEAARLYVLVIILAYFKIEEGIENSHILK